MPYLFLLFIIMPIAEIAVLIQVGGSIGVWTTIGIVILTAIIGTFMLRQQGLATLNKAQQRMQQGEMPAQQMLEGLLLLIGGVLLLTPGFITDFFGFCTLVPVSRQFLAKKLAERSVGNMNIFVGGSSFGGGAGIDPAKNNAGNAPKGPQAQVSPGGQPDASSTQKTSKNGGDIIEGDYRHLD